MQDLKQFPSNKYCEFFLQLLVHCFSEIKLYNPKVLQFLTQNLFSSTMFTYKATLGHVFTHLLSKIYKLLHDSKHL